jgi:hypothetical protein
MISSTVTNANDRSTRYTRVFLNAAEIGLGAEIIDRSKKIRKVVNSRIVSTITRDTCNFTFLPKQRMRSGFGG